MAKCKCGHGKSFHFVDGIDDTTCCHINKDTGDFCWCNEYRPAKKAEYDFDFCVSGLSKKDADFLFDVIVSTVEIFHGQVGGGFNENAE